MSVHEFLIATTPSGRLDEIALDAKSADMLNTLLKEQYYSSRLIGHGLAPDNKVMLHGASGCGKTMTANAIAAALGRKLFTVDLSTVVSARIGDTSKNLKLLFDKAAREKAVLFLDEFDQLGKSRGSADTDVGEMRRLVNSIIQLIDFWPADALLIAATNHVEVLDTALLRRFQLKVKYDMPNATSLDSYYDSLLERFPEHGNGIERIYNISYAEAKDHAFTSLKRMLLTGWEKDTVAVSENS